MNIQKHRFGHRRNNIQEEEEQSPPLTHRINSKFRNSAMNQYAINLDQNSLASYNRYSFDPEAQPVLQQRKQEINSKLKSFDNIRTTLDDLKKKIETAKNQLTTNKILNRHIISEESEEEEIKPFELISFHESSGSRGINSSSLDQSKKEFLEQLRKYEVPDIQVKGYYKADVVKSLKEGTGDVLYHIDFNWKVLRSSGGLKQPSAEAILLQKSKLKLPPSAKRTLVLGLDGTLVHVDDQKRSQDDIDVIVKADKHLQKKIYISLRPYSMTFLKRISKYYELIIFSERSYAETEAILDVLDPFSEMIKVRLSREHCMKVRDGVLTKDLRVIDRDLSQMLIADCEPYSYLFQVDNAVPIIPFHRGPDDQLYGLQKYLMEALRSSELRKFNKSFFQLSRYSQFGSIFQAVQTLYLLRH